MERNLTSIHSRAAMVIADIRKANQHISDADKRSKYCKMAASPFAFYRGTNHIFWKDFARDWRLNAFGNEHTMTWLNGDCHAANFGAFKAHTAGVVYGLNDFDEAIIADYQLDLWRLAVSLALIVGENKGLDNDDLKDALDALADGYLDTVDDLKGNEIVKTLVYTTKNTKGLLKDFLKKVEKKDSRGKMLEKWTVEENGNHLFDQSNPKVGPIDQATASAIKAAFPSYQKTLVSDIEFGEHYFDIEDLCQRLLAGTGSLGIPRYYALLHGPEGGHEEDIILDIKAQPGPTPLEYLPAAWQKEYHELFENEGIRYVSGYRALSYHPDDHLGWFQLGDTFFALRQRNPYKETFDTAKLKDGDDFQEMAEQWGMVLATEHVRADINCGIDFCDSVMELVKGNRKAFRKLLRAVAEGYAVQVEKDYQAFKEILAPDDCGGVD